MNNKHLSCVLILVAVAIITQLTLSNNNRAKKAAGDAERTRIAAANQETQLILEQTSLADLQKSASSLISYLDIWKPYFRATDTPEGAELKISLRIKEANLISLNQKYSVEGLKNNLFADSMVKAELTFEDNYAKLLNWLTQLETQLPTLRTKSVTITPGTNPADIRMELVLEQPLTKMQ